MWRERLQRIRQRFEQVLADAATETVVRTGDGSGANRNSLAEYTPEYAKYRFANVLCSLSYFRCGNKIRTY